MKVIRASEVAQYEYCARAWWLGRVQGYEPSNAGEMAAGEEEHERHGREVMSLRRRERLAYLLLALAALVGIALLFVARGFW
ncbi:MAG TPA: hypothetical protein EYP09_07365 [Anaerolineae bacterium]|nr:hypothetical protein [Anaerolineae bacterium]